MGWKTVGQPTSIERVSRAIHQKRLSHAYLICGVDGVGKLTFALDIAKIANCLNVDRDIAPCGSCNQCLRIEAYNHTDVHLYDVDRDSGSENHASTMVSIEQLREDFLKKVHRKPYEGRTRVFIISSVDSMRAEQSNILLKTLEEPPEDVMIILLAQDSSAVLATIVSRCQILSLEQVSEANIVELLTSFNLHADAPLLQIAKLARGRPEWARQVAMEPGILQNLEDKLNDFVGCLGDGMGQRLDLSRKLSNQFMRHRDEVFDFLDIAITWTRDVLLVAVGRSDTIVNISRKEEIKGLSNILGIIDILTILKLLKITNDHLRKNVTSSLVFDNMMLKLPSVGKITI